MPVHWSGKPCDMDRVQAIADKHGLAVVADACHAVKATYKNRKVAASALLPVTASTR